MTSTVRSLSRATVASGVATATEIGFLWILVHPLHVAYWLAFAVVQVYCNALTFLLYKYWAFEAKDIGRIEVQYAKQLLIFAGSWLLNTGTSSLLSYLLHIEPVVSFVISQIIVYLTWNYPGNKYFVFNRPASGLPPEPRKS